MRIPGSVRPRLAMTLQVGQHGRSINEVATELGCDRHIVMDVVVYGSDLSDDLARFGNIEAIGLDATLMFPLEPWKQQQWSTQIVDVGRGQLLGCRRGVTGSVGDAESVRPVPQSVRHGVARRCQGR